VTPFRGVSPAGSVRPDGTRRAALSGPRGTAARAGWPGGGAPWFRVPPRVPVLVS